MDLLLMLLRSYVPLKTDWYDSSIGVGMGRYLEKNL